MKRDPVSIIWLAGIGLAVLIYLVDPVQVLFLVQIVGRDLVRGIDQVVLHLGLAAFDVVRALALAAFAVFCALSVLAIRRGGRGRTALLAVTAVFLVLVATDGHEVDNIFADDAPTATPYLFIPQFWEDTGSHNRRWGEALLLSGVAALVMTRRVRGGVPARVR